MTRIALRIATECSVELRDNSEIDRHIGKDEAEEDRDGERESPRLQDPRLSIRTTQNYIHP